MRLFARSIALSLAVTLLAGCGSQLAPQAATSAARAGLGARNMAAMPLSESAKKAIAMVSANKEYRNPTLVSIEGRGIDATGRLAPMLGGGWTYKFWVTGREETYLINVIHHVEGDLEVEETQETKSEATRVMPLDPAKLAPPTQLVPYAIKLGLRVNAKGPSFNYYDITYNPFYADPSQAEMDTANVVSYYRDETLDGIRLPAGGASGPAPAAKKMSAKELQRDQAARRQHTI